MCDKIDLIEAYIVVYMNIYSNKNHTEEEWMNKKKIDESEKLEVINKRPYLFMSATLYNTHSSRKSRYYKLNVTTQTFVWLA